MKNKKLEAALFFQSLGMSVIPVRKDKKPYLKTWKKYQTEIADIDTIQQWYNQWPDANPAIVTGSISNIVVVDADSDKGREAVTNYIPDALEIPIAKTPRGWHFYFKYQPGLRGGPSIIDDCDIKTDGGYIIAPPSQNGSSSSYKWLEGFSLTDVDRPAIPK